MTYTATENTQHSEILDCIGIGFGPSNMALAISLQEKGVLDRCLFLEAADQIDWHPGMLIHGTDIQHNPLRDLVTPRNPASPYGFLSYLKANNRLFDYLNLDAPYPPRTEYAGYVRWIGQQFLDYVKLGTPVRNIQHTTLADGAPGYKVQAGAGAEYFARTISFGTGRSAMIPDQFQPLLSENVVHLTDYLPAKERWLSRGTRPRIAVVGGSQSSAEILLDLCAEADVVSIARSFGFKHKDLSPFTENIYTPSFVDFFHNAGVEGQNRMTNELWRSNYGAADPDVVAALNLRMYEQQVTGRKDLTMLHNTDILSVEQQGDVYLLNLRNRYDGQMVEMKFDGIVLGTGFRNFGAGEAQEPCHSLMQEIAQEAEYRGDGGVAIERDYQLKFRDELRLAPFFVNGLCEASHGFGDAGSFSLLSLRSDTISSSLVSYLHQAAPACETTPQRKEATYA